MAKDTSIPAAILKKIKAEYLIAEPKISVRKLAEKYDVSANALERAATEGKWKDLRRKTGGKVAEKTVEKLADRISTRVVDEMGEEIAARIGAHKAIIKDALDRLKAKADSEMTIGTMTGPLDIPFLNSPKDIKAWVDAVAKVVDSERKILGLDKLQNDNRPDDADFNGSLWEGWDEDEPDDDSGAASE